MTDKSNVQINPSSYKYDRSSYVVLAPIIRDPISGKLTTASPSTKK